MSAQPRHTRNCIVFLACCARNGSRVSKAMNLCRLNSMLNSVPRPALVPLQVCKKSAALLGRLDHIMQLAQHILKENMLLTQALHPMQLLYIAELQQQHLAQSWQQHADCRSRICVGRMGHMMQAAALVTLCAATTCSCCLAGTCSCYAIVVWSQC